MNTSIFWALFPAAERFDARDTRPELEIEEVTQQAGWELTGGIWRRTGTAVGVASSFSRPRPARKTCPELINNIRGGILRDEGDASLWLRQLAAARQVIVPFLRSAGPDPSLLCGHRVCWSDQAVGDVEVDPALELRRAEMRAIPHQKVRLRFALEGSACVAIDRGAFEWLRGPGECEYPPPLVKVEQSQWTCPDGTERKFPLHQELLGSGRNTKGEREYLKRGLFPGLRSRAFSLYRQDTGALTIRKPGARPGPGETLVDAFGIWDVSRLEAWRFGRSRASQGEEEIRIEGLSFSFDPEGLLACVATWSKRVGEWPLGSFWAEAFSRWVEASRRAA